MPTVTWLQVDHAEICPRESARVEAWTDPPDTPVKWSVDGQDIVHNYNTLLVGSTIPIDQGQTRTITASLDNSRSVTVTRKISDIQIELEPLPENGIYAITAAPLMPSIKAKSIALGGPASSLQWEVSVNVDATLVFETCSPHAPPGIVGSFDFPQTNVGQQITVDFGNLIRGGTLSIAAEGIVNGCRAESGTSAKIHGTNPQRSDIRAALPHDTLRRIACKESGQRQFNAPPDGGTGPCPLFGAGGKAGIMQVPEPTQDHIWNWRMNVARGVDLFNERVAAARAYPSAIRNSQQFDQLVVLFNQTRQDDGLSAIDVVLPDLTTGDFDSNLQQLELDAIRGYNGWHGSDRFGLDLHEFRVAVNLVNGAEVLAVTNINEATLHGEAVWERVPAQDRPQNIGDPDYVNNVLSFLADCSGASVTTNPCGATLRFLDFQNNEIDPNLQALSVSNNVSDENSLGGALIGFNDIAVDRDAFRLEVEDSIVGASVEVVLQVGSRPPTIHQLSRKSGNRYRGPFLRVVSDIEDELAMVSTHQNVFAALGEKVRFSYQRPPAFGCEDRHEIQIGRPVGEDNNDHPSHLRHDIRELKVNVVVFSTPGATTLDGAINATQRTIRVDRLADAHDAGFIRINQEIIRYEERSVGNRRFRRCVRGAEGTVAASHANGALVVYSQTTPAETRTGVLGDLDVVDERFAQAGIRIRRPVPVNLGGPGDPGLVLPPALFEGYRDSGPVVIAVPTPAEQAVFAFKSADPNSIDIFYVQTLFFGLHGALVPVPGTSYPAFRNNTGDNHFQNFIVVPSRAAGRRVFTTAHEIMHILLNQAHRNGEPGTALFHPTAPHRGPNSTKRIGPYPDANALNVGGRDTQQLRDNVETLPS